MAVGYDPNQRSLQWKRRVDREDFMICSGLLNQTSRTPCLDAQMDALQQRVLQGPGGSPLPTSSARGHSAGAGSAPPGSAGAASAGSAARQSLASARAAAAAAAAGRVILTPRDVVGAGPPSRLNTAGGVSSMSAFSSRSEASTVLRAELDAETRRRIDAEDELRRLKATLASGATGAGAGAAAPEATDMPDATQR